MSERNLRKIQLLEEALNNENFLKVNIKLPRPGKDQILNSRYSDFAKEIIKELGSNEFHMPYDLHYHMEYNGILIQFDDELHFNRYRKLTLESDFYKEYKGFNTMSYKTYCRNSEKECIKAGLSRDIWENMESKSIFGPSEEPGDLSLERNGSSGWKLRAWRDFLQDLSGEILGFKVLRISVYDKIMISGKLQSFGDLLGSSNKSNFAIVAKSLVRRIINIKGS